MHDKRVARLAHRLHVPVTLMQKLTLVIDFTEHAGAIIELLYMSFLLGVVIWYSLRTPLDLSIPGSIPEVSLGCQRVFPPLQ